MLAPEAETEAVAVADPAAVVETSVPAVVPVVVPVVVPAIEPSEIESVPGVVRSVAAIVVPSDERSGSCSAESTCKEACTLETVDSCYTSAQHCKAAPALSDTHTAVSIRSAVVAA